MLMVFSLVPYFDFSMSREEEASGRSELIKELGSWETYTEISKTKKEMRWSLGEDDVDPRGRRSGIQCGGKRIMRCQNDTV